MADLPPFSTPAEVSADTARNLPEFQGVALLDLRHRVGEMLALIGHVDGIFSTYTKHDISHIDAMLRMLSWLIPPSTAQVMTPADWLMITLAIYLHDLGMVVTAEEYLNRQDNYEFTQWRAALTTKPIGRSYLARTKSLGVDGQDRFFFQEFIRLNHARRVREWVTGRHSWTWGPHVKPIAAAVSQALSALPRRFRGHLADVCASHHTEDVDRLPFYHVYGNHPSETANVQYAAILLRTTDLLHVTKDRTPSIMYQLVPLSDPKAVEEWGKQRGVFAVRPKGRALDEQDPDTAVVQISADFSEEQPLLALQEYLAYADQQLKQSKRWADKSQLEEDARRYSFPWHTIKGDVRLEGVPPHPLNFELDRGRLLNLLVGHTIYNDPTVAIRELLQNGIDAVRFQHHLEMRTALAAGRPVPDLGRVLLTWNEATRLLAVEDIGVGMDQEVIKNNLMRVGASFYDTDQFKTDYADFSPISRFGIGILTCFMVSDDIEIVTCKNGAGLRIRMTSVHTDYLLRELPPGDPLLRGIEPHGTRVSLRLREDVDFKGSTVLDIVRYWVILPDCKVEYSEPDEVPIRIGYASPHEALTNLMLSDDSEKHPTFRRTEIVVKHRESTGEDDNQYMRSKYELAIAVESGLFPEKLPLSRRDPTSPAVCIEGIRASGELPWFEGRGLLAMLSVRGDPKFRTTVSRSGLERDTKYERVGRLCAEMLFEHAEDEVARIANSEGHPLSEASTAGELITQRLLSAVGSATAATTLRELRRGLTTIVVERQVDADDSSLLRVLVDRNRLEVMENCWTMESRLVDSLNLISRDLGREISLSAFLSSVAPSEPMVRLPLISEAHRFALDIQRSHSPRRVEFSRSSKECAVHWERSVAPGDNSGLLDLAALMGERAAARVADGLGYRRRRRGPPFVALIEPVGDDPRVDVVATRVGLFAGPKSSYAEVWNALRLGVMQLSERGYSPALLTLYDLALMWADFGDEFDAREWQSSVEDARGVLRDLKLEVTLPWTPSDLIEEGRVFNAARYWRDPWQRG
jgi:molecular chaperone HtpG